MSLQNSELAPLAKEHNPAAATKSRRTKLIWVLLVLYTFVFVVSLVGVTLALGGKLSLPEAAASYYKAFGFFDYAELSVKFISMATGIYLMFQMRAAAIYALATMFISGQVAWLVRFEQFRNMGYGVKSWMLGVAISLGIILYLWHLKRRGLLA